MRTRTLKMNDISTKWYMMMGTGILTMFIVLAGSFSADAAIRCKGQFQIVKGQGRISTPYCQDNYLASIARRSYGYKVSSRAVRQNPNLKARICRHIGHDSRLTGICSSYRHDGKRGGFGF